MKNPPGWTDWLKILFPLAFAAAFGLAVRPAEFDRALRADTFGLQNAESIGTILAYEPWRVDALEDLAREKFKAGDTTAVIHTLGKSGREDWLSLDGSRLLAAAFEEAGLYPQALDTRISILRREPQIRDNYLRVSRLEMDLGKFTEALDTLDQMLERFPEDAEGYYRRGLAGFALGHPEGVTDLIVSVRLDKKNQGALRILHAVDNQAGRSESPAHRLLLRGRGLGAVGEWAMAECLFEEVVRLEPGYAEGWGYLGEARQQTGTGDGLAQLRKAAELDPDSQTVRGFLALSYRRVGEFDKALEIIELAARTEPLLASWQVEWANTLVEKNDLEGALLHYKKALELEPANLDSSYLLAHFCLNYRMELRETGLPAARDGAAREPSNARWQDLLGSIFWALGDIDLAERSFFQALKTDPANAAASLHLGQYFLDQGDLAQAYPLIKSAATQADDAAARETAGRLLEQIFNEARPSGKE